MFMRWVMAPMMDIVSTPERLARGYFVVTGVKVSGDELLHIGERIYNVEKAFNSRLGLGRKDDNFSVPDKFLKEPLETGAFKGQTFALDAMLDEYYEERGWGMDGLQTRRRLSELGLEDVAEELASLGVLSEKA